MILSSEFENSSFPEFFPEIPGNLEMLWNLLFRANSDILGIIPTQFWSLTSILRSEFQNSSFPEIFWKSRNSLEFTAFAQFQCIGHHFHLILVTEVDFVLRN